MSHLLLAFLIPTDMFFFLFVQGKVPLLSLEAIHQLHIFIFVLAITHVAFSVLTILLGGAKVHANINLLVSRSMDILSTNLYCTWYYTCLFFRYISGNTGKTQFRNKLQEMVWN